jgi:glycosyltransferase involved in cell wall biosynthesis
MIAYHFPPQSGSSGVQRTLKFSQYLPQFGWEATVLTAHPRAYPRTSDDQHRSVPQERVHRAFALDAARHLSLWGRYFRMTALPDRWASWWLGAVPLGTRLARDVKFDAIWSTYPIATAHLIGRTLHKRTGLPWVADFRDPMTDSDYPLDPQVRRAYSKVEAATLANCSHAVFTTPGACQVYGQKFPSLQEGRVSVIANGHDEEDFEAAARSTPVGGTGGAVFVLLHSGIVYPAERDPTALFAALAQLRSSGSIGPANFRLVLRAAVHEDLLRQLIARHGIGDIVVLAPPLPYQEALAEMLQADGLLVLQGANCNSQIPAKLYEYLRARRPILALTDSSGDTAAALRHAGNCSMAPLDSSVEIALVLLNFMRRVRSGLVLPAPLALVQLNSRRQRTFELAQLLDRVVATHGGAHA